MSFSFFFQDDHRQEFRKWWALGWPGALRSVTDLLPWLFSLSYVGKLGVDELAALSLVEMWMYSVLLVCWTATGISLSSIVGQAHGARSVVAMRSHLATAMIFLFSASIFVCFLWLLTEPVLSIFFEYRIVKLGLPYVFYSIPNIFIEAFNIPIAIYFSAIHRPDIPLYAQIVGCVVDIVLSYVFIFKFELGLAGAALGWISASTSTALIFFFVLPWVFKHDNELRFGGADENSLEKRNMYLSAENNNMETDISVSILPSTDNLNGSHRRHERRSSSAGSESNLLQPSLGSELDSRKYGHSLSLVQFIRSPLNSLRLHFSFSPVEIARWNKVKKNLLTRRQWSIYLEQMFPNLFAVALSEWQLQFISFFAGKLGTLFLSAHNICCALFQIVQTFPIGMSEATSVRIGHHLGNRDVESAKRTARVSLASTIVWASVASLVGYQLKYVTGSLFTDDKVLLEAVAMVSHFFWPTYFISCNLSLCVGVLEGQGRAKAQSLTYFVGGWIVVIPFVLFLVYFNYTLTLGFLWMVLLVGNIVSLGVAAWLVYISDWSLLMEEAISRSK